MASYTIPLGSTDRLSVLYSYPNDPKSSETLADTILHWFNQTLDRDGFKARGATARVQVKGNDYSLVLDGPTDVAANFPEYGRRLPQFLSNGWDAYQVIGQLKTQTKTWPAGLTVKTDNKVWDPQNTGQWRFFLPLGLAMIRQRSLQFFHYPPIRLLDAMRDYLDDPVPVRWEELLEANGVASQQDAWLFETVMDGAPIAAPDDQGTQYVNGAPVHLIPIDAFHEYQRTQVRLLLNTSATNDAYTIPIVVYGSPGRSTFGELYNVKLSENQAATVEIIQGKKTAVVGAGHPYRFYAQAQIDSTTGAQVGSGKIAPANCQAAMQIMVQDLIIAAWQRQMADDPTQDPQTVLKNCTTYWQQPERAAKICALVQHEGSLLYPDPKSLLYQFGLTMQQAAEVCQKQGNNPCA